jgi:hypothetical protein
MCFTFFIKTKKNGIVQGKMVAQHHKLKEFYHGRKDDSRIKNPEVFILKVYADGAPHAGKSTKNNIP